MEARFRKMSLGAALTVIAFADQGSGKAIAIAKPLPKLPALAD
jgi:hypothetical protein